MKTYTFHVSLPGTGRAWRKIELRADQTLEDLHWAIQNAYNWDADHLYSFFMSGKAWDRSTEYCLPEPGEDAGPGLLAFDEKDRAKMVRDMAKKSGLPARVVEDLLASLEQPSAGPGDVRTTTLESLGLKRKQTFLYLFDYGDEWRFKVQVDAINENANPKLKYPRVVESVGKAPEQYPDWDEE